MAEKETILFEAIVQSSGLPPGVEHIQDKIPFNLFESLIYKVLFTPCFDWIDKKRAELDLPDLDFQGRFIKTEYVNRFPLLIPTSPAIYPEPHPSAEYLYVGGYRDEKNFGRFETQLELWMNSSDLDIAYISLGTQASIEESLMLDFIKELRHQKKYRVIWSLSLGLTRIADKHNLWSQNRAELFLSNYLPQYKLLGHPKVKIFVTHGGLGSLIDLVKQRVPAIAIPLYGDQFTNAMKIEQLSIGIQLGKFIFADVDRSISFIRENYKNFTKNLKIYNKELSSYEDPKTLNDYIEKISSRKQVTIQYSMKYQSNSPRYILIWKTIACSFYAFVVYILCKVGQFLKIFQKIQRLTKSKAA